MVAALRAQGHSLRAIAGAVGVTEMTVRRDISGATDVAPETVTGKDGKRYKARRTVVAARNEREAERAQQALEHVERPPAAVGGGARDDAEAACDRTVAGGRRLPSVRRRVYGGGHARSGAHPSYRPHYDARGSWAGAGIVVPGGRCAEGRVAT